MLENYVLPLKVYITPGNDSQDKIQIIILYLDLLLSTFSDL